MTLADDASTAGTGVTVNGNLVTITQGGYYQISGSLSNGRLLVETDENAQVVLSLSGVSITNGTEEALSIERAGSVTIYLAPNTANALVTGTPADISANPHEEEAGAEGTAAGGTLHAKTDMVICGEGALTVEGYVNNAIQSKNSLTIEGGALDIQAVNNGLKANTAVNISGGSVNILSGNDGVKSDGLEEGQGYVNITGGTLEVNSYGDGIQAENTLSVTAGEVAVVTNGVAKEHAGDTWGHGWGSPDSGWDLSAETSVSTKGLKAGMAVNISGGTISIDTADDGIHSNGDVNISGGNITTASGDDGIHGDGSLSISAGTVTVTESYEGLEAGEIDITGGDISVTSSDDGVNVAGGSSGGMDFGWGGQADASANMYFQGGSLYINAGGDGIDCNGTLYAEGGTIVIDGPANSGNGAMDSGAGMEVSGGTILALGASGMAESFSESSSQCSFTVNLNGSWQAGDTIAITDESGNVLFSHEAAKSGNSVVFSCPDLTQGETYTVTAGGQTVSITQNSVSAGSSGGGFGGFGGGGPRR